MRTVWVLTTGGTIPTDLERRGVLVCHDLPGPKCRITLMTAPGNFTDPDRLRAYLRETSYMA